MQRQTRDQVKSQPAANRKGVTGESASAASIGVPDILTSRKPIMTPRDRIRAVIARVAEAHNTTTALILSENRAGGICVARAEAIVAVWRAFPRLTLETIARHFGRSYSDVKQIVDRHAAREGKK